MSATPQSQAVNGVNDLLFVMQQLQQVRATVDNYLRQWTANGYATLWNAMATTAQNADGSLGTADGSPNTAHVIDTRLAGAAAMQVPISAVNLANAVTVLQALDAFFTNGAVVTSNRDAVMNLFRAG